VILGAIYLLFMFQKVFFGKLDKAKNGRLPDLRAHELVTFIPLCLAIFILGLFPRPILNTMQPSVDKFLHDYTKRLDEPDGPPHIYGMPAPGEPTPTATAPTGGAQ
jgi:NADH-quinone oxidoreductase subunit M